MQNITAANPGDFIRGAIIATATNCKSIQTKTGKTIFKCKLTDGSITVDATSFSRSFHELEGKRVEIGGKGIRRADDYNGLMGIIVGDKATFKLVAEPEGVEIAAQAPEPVKTQGNGVSKASKIEGVTVGMAINKAVDLVIASGTVSNERIYQQASDLIRLSSRLQAGELAPETPAITDNGPF